jgi:hypothetical protein
VLSIIAGKAKLLSDHALLAVPIDLELAQIARIALYGLE